MTTLHLIVHREILEKRLNIDNISPKKREHLESVLGRINEVIGSEEPVKELKGFPLNEALELCRGYPRVVLYGIKREACLRIVEEDLSSEGVVVSLDPYGTY